MHSCYGRGTLYEVDLTWSSAPMDTSDPSSMDPLVPVVAMFHTQKAFQRQVS